MHICLFIYLFIIYLLGLLLLLYLMYYNYYYYYYYYIKAIKKWSGHNLNKLLPVLADKVSIL